MMQQYHKAFSIFFKHDFFSDGNVRSFVVKPTTETDLVLKNAGGIVVPFATGVHVYYDSWHHGTERSRADFLAGGESLELLIGNNDANFFNYTAQFDTDISRNYFFFGNISCSLATRKEVLHFGPYVSNDDLRPVKSNNPVSLSKPFGTITIHMHEDLEESLTISFHTRSTHWCFVLATDYLRDLTDPAIINKETKEVFSVYEQIELSEKETVPAFFLNEPIPHHERIMPNFLLAQEYIAEPLRYKVVLPLLPGADPKRISALKIAKEHHNKNISFIFI